MMGLDAWNMIREAERRWIFGEIRTEWWASRGEESWEDWEKIWSRFAMKYSGGWRRQRGEMPAINLI